MAIDCYEPTSVLERAACAVDSLREQLLGIDLVYAQAAAALPAAETDALRRQQAAWAQETAAMCDVESVAAASRQAEDSLSPCLAHRFQDWTEWLQGYHRRIGRFDIVGRSIAQWSRDQYYDVRIHYPQLSNPTERGEQAFNDWAAAAAKNYAGELETAELARPNGVSDQHRKAYLPSMLSRNYRIELAGEDLIAVIWDDFVYGTGAAHGIPSTQGALFSLAAARPLSAADVFDAKPIGRSARPTCACPSWLSRSRTRKPDSRRRPWRTSLLNSAAGPLARRARRSRSMCIPSRATPPGSTNASFPMRRCGPCSTRRSPSVMARWLGTT